MEIHGGNGVSSAMKSSQKGPMQLRTDRTSRGYGISGLLQEYQQGGFRGDD